MKIILKILNYFFVTLGVLFFCLLIAAAYLYIADPFGIKPMFSAFSVVSDIDVVDTTSVDSSGTVDAHPLLNDSQESALKKVGIDPATVPTTITPEMEQCFIEKLGVSRVNEIMAGDAPTATDLFKARDCI